MMNAEVANISLTLGGCFSGLALALDAAFGGIGLAVALYPLGFAVMSTFVLDYTAAEEAAEEAEEATPL